ncbi:MAG: WGR domain-containing protein [Gemmataceae bacterium]|nr:WGR domain-containing protein [Gemmata sp.]MDW8199254.1 WGR domain-containing protein [Gemmataceae bacterium]
MRTFQLSDAKSHKFWNIDVQGHRFTVSFGKIGTAGQSQTKTFASAEEAQKEAEKLIREKLKKGYVETTPQPPASTEEAFIRALQSNPHDLAGWCAYADWLVEQGDPRGEFMRVQIALEDENLPKAQRDKLQRKEAALLKKYEKEWVGAWADFVAAPTDTEGGGQINHTGGRKYEFKRGVLTTVNFGQLTLPAAQAFVQAPETRFVRELFIGDTWADDDVERPSGLPDDADISEAPLYILLRWPYLRYVRRFQFGWLADEDYDDFCHFQCHLNGALVYDFVKQMPDVEELLIFAHTREEANKIARLKLPHLRVLQLYHGWNIPLETLAKNDSLTNLTALLCHPHALEYGDQPYIQLAGLRAICRSPYLPKLTHLRLRLADFGDRGVTEIIASGILQRLKVLDLRHGCITDRGAQALAACPELKNLEHLDLSRNTITEVGEEALRKTGVSVNLEYQHRETTIDPDNDPEFLMQGDYE